jgi:DNA-binding CsgD family transcriptional regulator
MISELALTDKEIGVLMCAADDMGINETAAYMHLGIETVKTYRQRIKKKLNVSTMPGAVGLAYHTGVLKIPHAVS